MSNERKPKLTLTDEMFSTFALRKNLKDQPRIDPGTSYEVFRNNTTAVEVIVKEVPNRDNKKEENLSSQDEKYKSLQEEVECHKKELISAKKSFQKAGNGFKIVIHEMKRMIDGANQREVDINAKIVALVIENEKLKKLLESKSNLLNKFKKELNGMKKSLKYLIKSMNLTPKVPYNMTNDSEIDYNEFETELKKDIKVKFAALDDFTFDSSISKGTKNSFEKH